MFENGHNGRYINRIRTLRTYIQSIVHNKQCEMEFLVFGFGQLFRTKEMYKIFYINFMAMLLTFNWNGLLYYILFYIQSDNSFISHVIHTYVENWRTQRIVNLNKDLSFNYILKPYIGITCQNNNKVAFFWVLWW